MRRDGADREHLAGDVGGAGGEQEAHSRLDRARGVRGDLEQVGGGAAAQLFADGAHEALDRLLRHHFPGRGGAAGRGAEDQDSAAGCQCAYPVVEEPVHPGQLGAFADPGGVEHQRARGRGGSGLGAGGLEYGGELLAEPSAAGRDHRSDQGGIAGLESAQELGAGQAEPSGGEAAHRPAGELLVAIRHGFSPY